jgi:hypothetical protein
LKSNSGEEYLDILNEDITEVFIHVTYFLIFLYVCRVLYAIYDCIIDMLLIFSKQEMNKTVQTKEDNNYSTQESVIQDRMLNEAIQEDTRIISEQVHIISSFLICLLSVFFFAICDCIIDVLFIFLNRR